MSAAGFLEKLLAGAKVEWLPLGDNNFFEVANTARRPVKASLRIAGMIPYYGANNIQDYVEGYTHAGEYVLIAEDGSASLENYSIQYVSGEFWANNHVNLWRVFLDPAINRGMIDGTTAFTHHLFKIVVADPIAAIPPHCP